MVKQTRKKNPPARTPEELAPEDPGGPGPPGEPPDAGAKASKASATLDAQSASLAPATVGRPTDTFTTNDVKPGPSTMEAHNTGTGNATMAYLKVPNAAGSGSTRSRIDETVEPRPEEELGRITRSKAQQTAGMPTMGRSRSDTGAPKPQCRHRPSRLLISTPPWRKSWETSQKQSPHISVKPLTRHEISL